MIIPLKSNDAFKFIVNNNPREERINDMFFFLKKDFVCRYNEDAIQFILTQKDTPVALFYLVLKDQTGYSPLKAPFGSVYFEKKLTDEVLSEFISQIVKWAVSENLKKLIIKNYPDIYDNLKSKRISDILVKNGFQVVNMDLNQHISVSEKPFEKIIAPPKRRKLKKCIKAGFKFKELDYEGYFDVAFQVIEDTRKRKGYPVTMEKEDLKNMFKQFPDNYYLFGVLDQDELIALYISILINKKILYNFYPGDKSDYRVFSPLVFANQGIYNFCHKNGIEIIDLGISTNESVLNYGLYKYKETLGSENSMKLTFLLDL